MQCSELQRLLKALVDNDVVQKLSLWEAVDRLGETLEVAQSDIGYLKALQFVVGGRVEKSGSCGAKRQLAAFLSDASAIEPTDEEVALAAEIEEVSAQCDLDMDVGESLLFSVALVRGVTKLATGDKRAVCCCSPLSKTIERIERLKGELVSLEQILARLLKCSDLESLRAKVCGAQCDRTASIAFRCLTDGQIDIEGVLGALGSYQADLASRSDGYTNPKLLV